MKICLLLCVLVLLCLDPLITYSSMAFPLETNSRWIVDEGGRRVKFACVNWVSHLDIMAAEGLSKRPLDEISKQIAAMGFNCVRLTWALFMVTDTALGSLTFRQSLQNHGLEEQIAGVHSNNPALLDLPLIQLYQAIVANLGDNKVKVIIDNHISKPGWCCSLSDGNGFFGDQYFDPNLWLDGLAKMASLFNNSTNVVAMSLRNELRGPKQKISEWYRYMQQGAEVVHHANPNVLVILSGLTFDSDLSSLSNKQVELTFKNKLVFELHWYSFSNPGVWGSKSTNEACGSIVNDLMRRGGFLLDEGWPVLFSEFGADQRGVNDNDNRYLSCFYGCAAELDLDWALWTLQGSYYLREGVVEVDEVYGLFDSNWHDLRNSSFLTRLQPLQPPFQGPGISDNSPYKVLFHPATGLCVVRKSLANQLNLGPCTQTEAWSYTPNKTLVVGGEHFCLQIQAQGMPATLGVNCSYSNSKWEPISLSKMHLSSTLAEGSSVCLDIDSDNTIFTNPCKCLGEDHSCDPSSQWFKIITSKRDLFVKG